MVRVEFFRRAIKFTVLRSLNLRFIKILIVLASSLLLSSAQSAIAQPAKTPKTCKVGAYLILVHDLDFTNNAFSADFWLWSNCPSEDLQPLKVVDFVNGNTKDITTTLDATYKRRNGYGSYVKVSGPFRHDWDVHNFPFDRHTLQITLENTNAVASDFIYTADKQGSKYNPDLKLDGWRITDFRVEEKTYQYATTFGDPDLPATGTSNYSRLHILISIARDSAIGFFKICAPVYIAFAISLLAYFLDTATAAGLLAGTLFAVVVNQQVAESILGSVEKLTLVDQIHLMAMTYILATAIVIVFSYIKSGGNPEELPIRRNRQNFRITWLSYLVVNIIVVVVAWLIG